MKIFWLKQNEKEVSSSTDWLHPSEQKVYSRFKFPKKQNDWLLGRWTAKQAVKYFMKNDFPVLRLNQIAILPAEDGAPEVFYHGKPAPVFITLSHSNGTGFCAVSPPGIKLGCDLEKIEPRSQAFVQDYFTTNEQAKFAAIDNTNHALWANLIWSAKESALKALRTGLAIDTRKVEVESSAGNELLKWNKLKVTYLNDGSVFHGYWRFTSEFVFTVVSDSEDIKPVEIQC